ncbi:unnamed protein product [Coccothraustes coccothraustes]
MKLKRRIIVGYCHKLSISDIDVYSWPWLQDILQEKVHHHQLCMSNPSGCTGTAGEEGKVSEDLLSELHQ